MSNIYSIHIKIKVSDAETPEQEEQVYIDNCETIFSAINKLAKNLGGHIEDMEIK